MARAKGSPEDRVAGKSSDRVKIAVIMLTFNQCEETSYQALYVPQDVDLGQ